MDKQLIALFGIREEDGINVLVDAIIYTYESISVSTEGELDLMYRGASIEDCIPVLQACPQSEEERNFLFYMFGAMNISFWTGIHIVLSMLEKQQATRDMREQAVRLLLDELIFSSH